MVFGELIKQPNYAIEHASLLLAKEVAYHNMDVNVWLQRLDHISEALRERVQPRDSRHTKLRRMNHFLFEEKGFYGNIADYYDPRNSFLNDVLKRRTGIPITLSILYVAVGRRLNLPVYGVGLPGHFIVGCKTENDPVYIDPYHAGIELSVDECREIANEFLPSGFAFSDTFLAPQPKHLILGRMLTNLRQIYLDAGDTQPLLSVLQLQQELNPQNLKLIRDLGVLYIHLEQWGLAVRNLRHYLYHRPRAKEAKSLRELLYQALEYLCKLN